jgi:diguanylate cyclase (GGDEF)-like protein
VFAERVMRAIKGLTVVVTIRPTSATAVLSEGALASTGGSQPLLAPVPTVSVGLAAFPDDARNPETLLAQADAALYRAKRSGRNKIAF